ncbi:MAG: hypothetical protein FVQ83_16600 [Chloroflexi bacterium]|nr:hypothetical protein [Chloroflexota bacterium]
MIIHQPEIISQGGYTTVWAKVELEKKIENFPEHIWYRVPDQFGDYLSLQSDAFLVPVSSSHF